MVLIKQSVLAFFIGWALMALFMTTQAPARDDGQWEGGDPAVREWYKGLMRPDVPAFSCCGEADAYWCDDISVRNNKTYCKITDPRPDEPLRRPHRAIGTEFEIPNDKLKYDRGNPTGHAVLFISSTGLVYCFVTGTLS